MKPKITPEGQAAASRIAEFRENVNNGATSTQARENVRQVTAGPTAPVAPVQPTVSANALTTPVAPVTVSTPALPTIPSRLNAMVSNVQRDAEGFIGADTEARRKRDELQATFGALNDQGSLADMMAQQRQDLGIDTNLKELKDIQLQLTDANTASDLTKTRIEGGAGQTLGQAGREITQEDRENAVRNSGLAARAAVLQGNIETATALAKDTVNLAFQDRQLTAQNLIQQINMVQGQVDEQTAQLLETEKRGYEAELAAIKELKDNIANAMVNGASQAEISQLNDPTIDDATKLSLAQQITARGANQMRNLEIQSKQASIANSYDAIADRKARLALAQQEAISTQLAEDATEAEVKVAKADKALGILASVNELMNHPGFGAAVGPNPLARVEYGLAGGVFQGLFTGNKSEFKSEVDQLANTLTLENMALLKGPATDKDVEIVQNSMSRLKNMDVSEASYAEELQRLYDASNRIVQAVGITPEQAQFYGIANLDQVNEAEQLWNGTSQSTPMILGTQTF